MGLDNMRGSYGRCPPILVGGLLVMCFILTFNWWSLSSQNNDLIKQLEDLSEQLKISSEEQDLCVRQRLSFEGRVKTMEEEMAQLRVRLEQRRTDNDEIRKQLGEREEELKNAQKVKEEIQSTVTRCNTELESLKKLDLSKDGSIATLRVEKEHLGTQLEEKKQELSELRAELMQVRIELNSLKHAEKSLHEPVKGSTAASAPLPKTANVGVSVGGNHELSKTLDLDKVDNEENNARERDDVNGDNEGDAAEPGQIEEMERMVMANDENEEQAKKDNVDTAAHNNQV